MPSAYRNETKKFAVTCDMCNVLLEISRRRKFARCTPCITKYGRYYQPAEQLAALLALNPHP